MTTTLPPEGASAAERAAAAFEELDGIASQRADYRRCEHGYHHPPWPHSCDGCWCEGERDQREYGWPHDTSPKPEEHR